MLIAPKPDQHTLCKLQCPLREVILLVVKPGFSTQLLGHLDFILGACGYQWDGFKHPGELDGSSAHTPGASMDEDCLPLFHFACDGTQVRNS